MRTGPPDAPAVAATCLICGLGLRCRWTDSHGIGACLICGAPYRLLHYDGDGKGEQKPPYLLLNNAWVPLIQRYWQECARNVCPGAFNFPGSSYEVAEREDFESWNAWAEAHKAEWPSGEG